MHRGVIAARAGVPLSPCFGRRWRAARPRLKRICNAGAANTLTDHQPMPTALARTTSPREVMGRQVLRPDLGEPRLAWWRTQSCQSGLWLRFPVKQGKSMDSGRKRPAPAWKSARSRRAFNDFRVGCAKFQTGNLNRGNREWFWCERRERGIIAWARSDRGAGHSRDAERR